MPHVGVQTEMLADTFWKLAESVPQAIMKCTLLAFVSLCATLGAAAQTAGSTLGAFDNHGDVGENPKPGYVQYDAGSGEYRVAGGGANIWGTMDAFHFLWKKL